MGRTRTAWRRSLGQPVGSGSRLSRNQIIAVIAAMAMAVAGLAVAAALVSPNRARTFDLIHGSLFLADDRAPVAIDLATGKPTVRLVGANSQVDAAIADLSLVPLSDSTLLLNDKTGEFNLVDGTGFVVKTTAGGVPLPRQVGDTSAMAVPDGNAAFVIRGGSTNTSVFLVNAATVQAAARPGARVTPRASLVLSQAGATGPGLAVAGNGQLWLLTGHSDSRTLRQLSLPPNSETGATLTSTSRETLSGLARLESVPGGTTGAPDTVVLATPAGLTEFSGAGAGKHTVKLSGLSGADQILPVTDAGAGTAAFLFHTSNAWSLVTLAAQAPTADIHVLKEIPAKAQLATPAISNGALYTMDRGASAAIWRIALSGSVKSVAGAGSYPVPRGANGKALEVADFGAAQVIAQRSRVLFNDPDHVLALAVFTDGSRPATVIDKSSATDLNAVGGAGAITTKHNNAVAKNRPARPDQPAPQPKTPSAPTVNNKITCQTTTQTPHVPTITTATSASRSVLLSWNYPLLDSQDCEPSTYQVAVKTLTDGSPAAPGTATVQGQTQVNLTGLYPSTRYQMTVTAYLNGRGTSSTPVVVTTGPEGPAAPTGVSAKTDSGGNWTISWHACGSVKQGCVPAATWSVIPQFCDGVGLANPPAPLPVAGDETLTSFSTDLAGGAALLGRGLSFTVQGISDAGNVGTTSASTGCVYSWSPPDAGSMHLAASVPSQTDLGGSTTSTFTLDLGKDPTAAVGGVGGEITFQLLVDGKVVQSKGPGTANTAVFDGITAGTAYSGQAIVTPPRHAEAAVTVGPVSVSTRSNWPQSLAVTTAKVTPSASDPRTGTLTVTLGGLASSQADGERFQLTDSSAFRCGNTQQQLSTDASFDPSTVTISLASVNLLQYYGSCVVSVQLVEDPGAGGPQVFGGTQSQVVTANVSMPGLPTGGVSPSDFTAAWDPAADDRGYSTITVKATGNNPKLLFVVAWAEDVDDSIHPCAHSDSGPPVTIEVADACVQEKGDKPNAWTVTVTYRLLGQQDQTVAVNVTGTPPTYRPPSSGSPSSSPPPSSSPTPSPSPSSSSSSSSP